ncbi:MAG: 30S ribosome-binding factor RbfA [Terriglobales bacterium]
MQHGGAKHHRERMTEALRDEISTILEGELGDPRIGLVSVTEAQLSPDGRTVRVFVSVEGDGDEAVCTMEGLSAARNFIRRELASRLRLRQPPEVFFQLDNSSQYGARIEELLKRIHKRGG